MSENLPCFRVTGQTSLGERFSFTVRSPRENMVRRIAGLPEKYITSIKQDVLGRFRSKRSASYLKQAMVLNSLSIRLARGEGSIRDLVTDILLKDTQMIQYLGDTQKCNKLSEFLVAMQIHPAAIKVAAVGDKTGELDKALVEAADILKTMAAARAKLVPALSMAGFYLFLSITMIMGFSVISVGAIDGTKGSGMKIETNLMTTIFYSFGQFVQVGWYLVILAIGVLIYYRDEIFYRCRHWPILSTLDDLIASTRASIFSTIFVRMIRVYSPLQVVEEMATSAKSKHEKEIYLSLIKKLRAGKRLSQSMDVHHWPTDIIIALDGIESMRAEDQSAMLTRIRESLNELSDFQARKLKTIVVAIGLGGAILAIIGVAVGVYLPMVTVASSGVGG